MEFIQHVPAIPPSPGLQVPVFFFALGGGQTICQKDSKLKADRPHPHNYLHTPTDYRYTDKNLRLVMVPAMREDTDGRTDGQTLPSTLSPSLRGL